MSSEAGTEPLAVTPNGSSGGRGRPWLIIALIWIVVTAAGIIAALVLPRRLLPAPASSSGTDLVQTVEFLAVLASPVVAAVVAVVTYSIFGWSGGDRQDRPPPVRDDAQPWRTPVAIWVSASLVVLAAALGWGLSTAGSAAGPRADALQVAVTGHQWLWTYSYPGTGVSGQTLVLPVGRPIEFRVTSDDVTHGFHPVQFGTQVDAVPGKTTVLRLTPDRLGPFQVDCTQICGLYHSLMISTGSVVSSDGFVRWLESRGATVDAAVRTAQVQR